MRQTEVVTPKLTLAVLVFCFLIWGLLNKLSGDVGELLGTLFPNVVGSGRFVATASVLGYCLAALPAAFFNWHVSYKAGIMSGLFLVAVSALAIYPASLVGSIEAYVGVFLLQSFGLCFIEMASNTYALTMGDASHALFRLSLAQCFNTLGWFLGAVIYSLFVFPDIIGFDAAQRLHMQPYLIDSCREADMQVVMAPYVWVGVATVVVIVLVGSAHFSVHRDWDGWQGGSLGRAIMSLMGSWSYVSGCISLFLYVGAQTCCVIMLPVLARSVFEDLDGFSLYRAVSLASDCSVFGFALFFLGRIVFTWRAHKGFDSLRDLRSMAFLSTLLLFVASVFSGVVGVMAVIAVCFCFAAMFPIIFANSLMGFDAAVVKVAAAGMMFAFAGSIALPSLQMQIAESDIRTMANNEALSLLVPAFACLAIGLIAHLSHQRLPRA